ncbi:MAG: S9 family peptidase [Alphaproteobacteria bacterium]|nr:S9 family peptidase [Alphaproteobacteria bacterium]
MDSIPPEEAAPPRARQEPVSVLRHGDTVVDEYAWLRARDWRQAMRDPATLEPDIRAYLEAENAYVEAVMRPLAALRQTLVSEMRARIKDDDATVPTRDGPYSYFQRYRAGGQHALHCRRPVAAGTAEQVLVDGDREADGAAFFRMLSAEHSPDHSLLATAVDRSGAEDYAIEVRDLTSGAVLPDTVSGTKGEIVWAADSRSYFYTVLDENHRSSKVRRHTLGSDPAGDPLVYDETDTAYYITIDRSEDRRFLLITCHGHSLTTEVWAVPTDRPDTPARSIAGRTPGVEYSVSAHGDVFYILTNDGGALDFKIVTAPIADAGRDQWRDKVPHRPGRYLRQMLLFQRFMVRLERENALPRIVITELASRAEHAIEFAEEAYELGLAQGYEFDTATLRFTYGSPTTPQKVFDYDMAARSRILRKQQEVPSGHDPKDYVCRRLFATSADGASVPVTVLHHISAKLDGSAPLLLYGYGAYGFSIPAMFAANRLSLVDRGFVYAIAHVRGGSERGTGWYLDGKLAKKRHTFLDMIAAGEALIAAGYTRAGRIAIHGASAGGLLVGAVANMRPDLLHAVVADVPFVDVLNTMSDAELPLTPPEWSEWGDPVADPAAYALIRGYSPYDNVRAQRYPHMLVTAGLSDPRVTYWEPAKWVARLRARRTDSNLLLLHTNMAAGHGGKPGRFDKLDEVALVYAFLLHVFDLAKGASA